MEVRRIPASERDPVHVLDRGVLVRTVWLRCPLIGIMSFTFYLVSSSIVEGRVEACLRQFSRDSIGASLWWICLDPIFIRLRLSVYKFDPSDRRLSSSVMIVA